MSQQSSSCADATEAYRQITESIAKDAEHGRLLALPDEWLRFEDEVRKKPRFDRRMVSFQNYYLGGASECAVDKQGRILIPPLLREYAGLKRDVVLVSALDKFRVWDQQTWKKVFAEAEEKLMQDPDFLGDLGL